MAVCYLGVGANLGNRAQTIRAAFTRIDRLPKTRLIKASSLLRSAPVGGPAGQPWFLNAAARISTALPPRKLLMQLQKIEQELGRKRSVRRGPRAIDIDILLYADRFMHTPELSIPHPRMFERAFVMRPLAEVL